MNEKIKKYMWIWLPLAILAVSATIVGIWLALAPAGSVGVFAPSITPTKMTADGKQIEPDTAFAIGGYEEKTETELREQLELVPDMGYGLRLDTSVAPPVWVLIPSKQFAPDAEVTVKFGLHTADFTVAPHIVATGVYPKSGSTGVSVNNGVEIGFNIEEVNEAMVKPALTVTPPLDYYIGWGHGSIAIYPSDKQMAYDTEYTFTLSADKFVHPSGYKLREDYTMSFKTISELGERMERLMTIEGGDTYNTLTTTPPMLELYFDEVVYNFNAEPKLKVNLYSYPDTDSYKRAIVDNRANTQRGKGEGHFIPSTEGLTSYASFEAEPFRMDESGRYGRTGSMVPFPEALPEGRYLAELCYDTGENYTVKRYKLIQSSDLSVYFVQTGDSMVVWTNDTTTGKPAEGATFVLEGDAYCPPVKTGSDGVATIKRASLGELDWGATATINLDWQGHTFVDSSAFSGSSPNDSPQLHYTTTLFTDRPLYKSTDTVKVWGMLRPRRDDTPAPQNVTLEMDGIDPVTVTLNDKGFFTAEVALDNFAASYGWLNLMVDGKQISSHVLRIYNYIKPVYTATIEPTQQFYMIDDIANMKLNINVSSFDGTPTPVWKGTVGQEWGQDDIQFAGNGNLTTDDKGNASVAVTSVRDNERNDWYPTRYGITLRNRDAEAENYLSSSYLSIVPRDLMLEGSMKASGGTATVTINTNKVDLTRANAATLVGDDWYYYGDTLQNLLRGDAVSAKITAKLYSTEYVKKQVGTSYDYINRVSVPRYEYDRAEKVEQEIKVTTDERGVATIPNLPCVSEDKSYRLELNTTDSKGRAVVTTVYLSMDSWLSYDRDLYYYSLRKVVDPAKILAENDGSNIFSEYEYLSTFTDNETVTFRLSNNGVPVDTMKGRILWTTVQTDFENLTVTDKDIVSLPFAESLLPNYTLTGAYFDGKNVFPLQVTQMSFDAESRRLDIALATDRDEYHPGDKVAIDATVTEQATGKPAANAELVVAVVDEAIFAIQNQRVQPLEEIYDNVFYPIFTQYTSNGGSQPDGGAEKGGGGGETPIRDKFPDTALWAVGKTDQNGKATLSLTLPDSITSWRVTSLAVTDNNFAGNNKYNFVATKEFFVSPSVSNELLVGDSFTVGLRGSGKGVATDDPVSYTVSIQGASNIAPQTITTKGIREYGWATFEGLEAGDYNVTITGSCKEYTDGVKLPFTVLTSGVEMQRYQTMNLANGLKIDSLRFPVDVTMYSPAYKMYNEVLWAARSQSYGSRADMQLGLAVTDKLLSRRSEDGSQYSGNPEAVSSLTANGAMLKLFPHDANPDVRLNALANLVASDIMGYINVSYDGTSNPTTAWELASPGAFYLLKATIGLYDSGSEVGFDSMSLVDKLDVGMAHVLADDVNWARKLYDTEVTPRLQKLTGVSGETAYFLPEVGGKSSYDCTAAALRLAIMLGHPDADPLMRYLLERPSTRDPYIMEKLLYLAKMEPTANNVASTVSYMLDGKRKTVDLTTEGMVSLSLSRNQLASLDVKVDAGEAIASVRYTDEPDSAALADKKLKITKTIVPADGTDSYKVGDLVKITLTPDLSGIATGIGDGELVIDDYIPSGMKFDRYEPSDARNVVYWYMVSREGQRVRFSTSLDQGRMIPVVYYARGAMPGSYVVEGTLITAGAGSTWGSSERATLTVSP